MTRIKDLTTKYTKYMKKRNCIYFVYLVYFVVKNLLLPALSEGLNDQSVMLECWILISTELTSLLKTLSRVKQLNHMPDFVGAFH